MDAPRQFSDRRPSFFWQGCLILTPIAILTLFGFISVRQDWMMVEQEARQRASELANDLKTRLGRAIADELIHHQLVGNLWEGNRSVGNPTASTEHSPRNDESNALYKNLMSESQSRRPALSPKDVISMRAQIAASGDLVSPVDYPNPPIPPAWIVHLEDTSGPGSAHGADNPPQLAEEAQAERPSDNSSAVSPIQSRIAISELAQLDAALRRSDTAHRLQLWVAFAARHQGPLSESGLPLSTIALARALREVRQTGVGLTESLFNALAHEARTAPSVLMEQLLSELEQLTSKPNSPFQDKAANLRKLWAHHERLRALARRVRETLPQAQIHTTNHWLDWNGNRWLAVLNEGRFKHTSNSIGQTSILTNRVTDIRFFPKAAVSESARAALAGLSLAVPPYFGIHLELENESLLGALDSESLSSAKSLAKAEGYLTAPNRNPLDPSAESITQSENLPDAFPSHPRFVAEIGLTHPELLYAQARRRSILVGGTIASAALAALLGLLIARRAFRQQQRLNEMKSNFVSSVSHEIRAPIASMRLMAEGLETGRVKDESKRREYFAFLVRECRRLGSLIENVLDFSRIDQGRKEYEFEPTDLAALVRETTAGMEPQAADRNIRLNLSFPEASHDSESGFPRLDGRAIQQALVNLIDNAIKHSPEGSTVNIGLSAPQPTTGNNPQTQSISSTSSQRAQPAIQIWVQDQGDGIPLDEQERIFQRFYRRGSELRRETQGVGIGLSIVKHITEAHGGQVTVQSKPGQGSRFTIELPVNRAT